MRRRRMNDLTTDARRDREELIALRRDFHRHPELSGQEHETAARIERQLDALGIGHQRVGKTGVLGVLRGRRPGDGIVALRADIDALPIREQNDVPYRSETDGVMHACGHDAHTACLLGAAKLLKEREDVFSGEVRLLFQPAEEQSGGARDFIEGGHLTGVRRVFGLHCAPDLLMGTVGLKPGLNNAAVDQFRILVHGRSTHVSTPHLGADALYAACEIVTALQGLVTRRTSPVEPMILGVGMLRAGTAYNAVAEEAKLEGTTRTVSREMRTQLRSWIEETVQKIAAISGCTAEVLWINPCSVLINDPDVTREVQEIARTLDLDLTVLEDRPLSLAGDNFADYQEVVPGCYAYLGTHDPARPETGINIHNGHFELDEDALITGASLYAACALHWLGEGEM